MLKFLKGSLVAGLILIASSAFAQTTVSGSTISNVSAAGPSNINIVLSGTLTSSLQLSVTSPSFTGFNTGANQGLVDLGTFDTVTGTGMNPLANPAVNLRIATAPTGRFIAIDVTATLSYNGVGTNFTGVAVNLGPVTNVSDVRMTNAAGVFTTNTDGNTVAGQMLCGSAGPGAGAKCTNSLPYTHQVGLFLDDTLPAGPFSAEVQYVGTAG
jgi:hypothetical protein